MNENLLTRMLPVIYGDESVSGLVIKPLNLSQEAFGLNLISVTHDVTGMKYRLSCFYIVFGFLMLSAGRANYESTKIFSNSPYKGEPSYSIR